MSLNLPTDEDKYALKDRQGEDKHGMQLARSIRIAKQKGPIFEGRQFYLTPNVAPAFEHLKTIIEGGGGKVCTDALALSEWGFDSFYPYSR